MRVIEAPYSSDYGSTYGYLDIDSCDFDSTKFNSILAIHFHRDLFDTLKMLYSIKANIMQIILFDCHPISLQTVEGIHHGEYGVIIAEIGG